MSLSGISPESAGESGSNNPSNEEQISSWDIYNEPLAQAGKAKNPAGKGSSDATSNTADNPAGKTNDASNDPSKPTWEQGKIFYASSLEKLRLGRPDALKDLQKTVEILDQQFDQQPNKAAAAQIVLSAMYDSAIALGQNDERKPKETMQEQRRAAEKIFSQAQEKYGKYMRPGQRALLFDAQGQNLSDLATTDLDTALSKAREQFRVDNNQQKFDQVSDRATVAFRPEMDKAIKAFEQAAELSNAPGTRKSFQAQVLRDLANAEMERSDQADDKFSQNSTRHFKEALNIYKQLAPEADKIASKAVQDRLAGRITDRQFTDQLRMVDKINKDRGDTVQEYGELLTDQIAGHTKLQEAREKTTAILNQQMN